MGNDASHPVDLTDLPKLDFGPVVNEASECCQKHNQQKKNKTLKFLKSNLKLLIVCLWVCLCVYASVCIWLGVSERERINQNCCVVSKWERKKNCNFLLVFR
jgi:hypothetical protein